MKRIAALRTLSTDHHHGLLLAHKAKQAATAASQNTDHQEIWSALLDHAAQVLESHFKIEENCVAAALDALNDPQITPLVKRLFTEHATLRTLLSAESPRNTANLKHLGELLEQHIRFEERELFEVAQKRLDPQTLEMIADACSRQEK